MIWTFVQEPVDIFEAFFRALLGAACIGEARGQYLACVHMDGRVVSAAELAHTQVDGWPK